MSFRRVARRIKKISLWHTLTGSRFGFCDICDHPTLFVLVGPWRRDQWRCLTCRSVPRQRAVLYCLKNYVPHWRELRIHESSPGGASSERIANSSRDYTASHFFQNVQLGQYRDGFRCENLEQQSFENESFDLVVTQDVVEHILRPQRAFAEIARTLTPGGIHLFTVPWYYWRETVVRARATDAGIDHVLPPDYHGNPIDERGSLVVTEWGRDLCDVIFLNSGMSTTVIRFRDRSRGIDAAFNEVFLSRKPL